MPSHNRRLLLILLPLPLALSQWLALPLPQSLFLPQSLPPLPLPSSSRCSCLSCRRRPCQFVPSFCFVALTVQWVKRNLIWNNLNKFNYLILSKINYCKLFNNQNIWNCLNILQFITKHFLIRIQTVSSPLYNDALSVVWAWVRVWVRVRVRVSVRSEPRRLR